MLATSPSCLALDTPLLDNFLCVSHISDCFGNRGTVDYLPPNVFTEIKRGGYRYCLQPDPRADLFTEQYNKISFFLQGKGLIFNDKDLNFPKLCILCTITHYIGKHHLVFSHHTVGIGAQETGINTHTLATAITVSNGVLCLWPGSAMSSASIHEIVAGYLVTL